MNLINVNNLSKSFRRGERDFFAIDNVSFDVKEKDFINIIGKVGVENQHSLLFYLQSLNPHLEISLWKEKIYLRWTMKKKADIGMNL